MGPGMMAGGYANEAYAGLDLSSEQRKKIAEIQRESGKAQWQLMGTMHQQGYHMYGMFGPGVDEADARKAFQTMTETRKAMFEMQLEARKMIDAVLTKGSVISCAATGLVANKVAGGVTTSAEQRRRTRCRSVSRAAVADG